MAVLFVRSRIETFLVFKSLVDCRPCTCSFTRFRFLEATHMLLKYHKGLTKESTPVFLGLFCFVFNKLRSLAVFIGRLLTEVTCWAPVPPVLPVKVGSQSGLYFLLGVSFRCLQKKVFVLPPGI